MEEVTASTQIILAWKHDPDASQRYDAARKEAMRLLYLTPKKLHLLPEEACSDFLLYCMPSIDRYLEIYDPSRLPFEQFIEGIVRRRAPALEMRRRRQEQWRDAVTQFPLLVLPETVEETQPEYHPRSRVLPLSAMPRQFQALCQIRQSRIPSPTPPIARLAEKLAIPWIRKGFILLLTTAPGYCLATFPQSMALLLGVPEASLQSYLLTAESVLAPLREKRTRLLESVNFHYRRMIQCQWESQYAMARELHLLRMAEHNRKLLHRRVEELQHQSFCLSHTEVSRLVGIARGTVNSGTYCARAVIRECLDDEAAKKYG